MCKPWHGNCELPHDLEIKTNHTNLMVRSRLTNHVSQSDLTRFPIFLFFFVFLFIHLLLLCFVIVVIVVLLGSNLTNLVLSPTIQIWWSSKTMKIWRSSETVQTWWPSPKGMLSSMHAPALAVNYKMVEKKLSYLCEASFLLLTFLCYFTEHQEKPFSYSAFSVLSLQYAIYIWPQYTTLNCSGLKCLLSKAQMCTGDGSIIG